MPYDWQESAPEQSGAVSVLRVWPYRSLSARGFVWTVGLTAGFLTLPLLAVVGTDVLWGLLPFAVLAIWALWSGIRRSYRAPSEEMRLSRDALTLTRRDPGRADRIWRTNPYWVRTSLRSSGPVESYLVLTDGQREVELGAFLAPEERVTLHRELSYRLSRLRR